MPAAKDMRRGGSPCPPWRFLLGALLVGLFAFVFIPGTSGVAGLRQTMDDGRWTMGVDQAVPLPASSIVHRPSSVSVATNTPACGLAWRQVSIPLPVGQSELDGVAGLGPNDVWAVGSFGNGTVTQTLTMHWDGSQWSIVPSPNVGANSMLVAVAAPVGLQASNGVWAMGYSGVAGASQTLVMRWDGSQWSIVPSPNVGGTGSNILEGVAFAG